VRASGTFATLLLALGACGLAPPESPSAAPPPAPPVDAPPPPPAAGPAPAAPAGPVRTLVWSDEFDGAALDPAKWRIWTGPRRDAVVSADAVTVAGGLLRIATFTEGGEHRTALLGTDGRLEATYGYYEARIRFHGAPGHWCAFWLFAPTVGRPIGDPASAGVEIDVVEHRVTDDGGWQLADHVAVTLNWDGYGPERQNRQRVTTLPGGAPVNGAWHTYAVLWTPTAYTFYVDDVPLWTTTEAVSRRSEWVHLSCEVDDGSWAGFVPDAGYGSRATSTTGMEVDWVRVWAVTP
jgi:beta-glucanase (GH16 family)